MNQEIKVVQPIFLCRKKISTLQKPKKRLKKTKKVPTYYCLERNTVECKNDVNFRLEQAKSDSKMRMQCGDAKPIDHLLQYITNKKIAMHEPSMYLMGLHISDLENLLIDIRDYVQLEGNINAEYWEDLTIIAEDEIRDLRELKKSGWNYRDDDDVDQNIRSEFEGKSLKALMRLHAEIKQKMSSNISDMEKSYVDSALKMSLVYLARARLWDQHQKIRKW